MSDVEHLDEDLRCALARSSKLNQTLFALRSATLRVLAPHTQLAGLLISINRRRNFFNCSYDIIVDGFPRSANTFTLTALRISQPHLLIVGHRHCPVDVIYAIRRKKPVCLLIREPKSVIASWIIYTKSNAEQAIEKYIRYYELLMPYLDDVVIAEFRQTLDEFPQLVESLRSKYGLPMLQNSAGNSFRDKVSAGVLSHSWSRDPLKVSLPNEKRAVMLEKVKCILGENRFSRRLARAQELYDKITGHIQGST